MHPLGNLINTNIILTFHDIISRERFKKQLLAIGKFYSFVSIKEIDDFIYKKKPLKNACHLTFDDGDKTFYTNALPVLQELNIPATIFVSPRIIEPDFSYWFQDLNVVETHLSQDTIIKDIARHCGYNYKPLYKFDALSVIKALTVDEISDSLKEIMSEYNITPPINCNLSKEELIEIHKTGLITVGAHTLNHPLLMNETASRAEHEVKGSVTTLEEILDTDIYYFAYPNGVPGLDFTEREIKVLKRSGIRLAFSTKSICFDHNADPYAIPRGGFGGGRSYETSFYTKSKLFLMPLGWSFINELKDRISIERHKIYKKGLLKDSKADF